MRFLIALSALLPIVSGIQVVQYPETTSLSNHGSSVLPANNRVSVPQFYVPYPMQRTYQATYSPDITNPFTYFSYPVGYTPTVGGYNTGYTTPTVGGYNTGYITPTVGGYNIDTPVPMMYNNWGGVASAFGNAMLNPSMAALENIIDQVVSGTTTSSTSSSGLGPFEFLRDYQDLLRLVLDDPLDTVSPSVTPPVRDSNTANIQQQNVYNQLTSDLPSTLPQSSDGSSLSSTDLDQLQVFLNDVMNEGPVPVGNSNQNPIVSNLPPALGNLVLDTGVPSRPVMNNLAFPSPPLDSNPPAATLAGINMESIMAQSFTNLLTGNRAQPDISLIGIEPPSVFSAAGQQAMSAIESLTSDMLGIFGMNQEPDINLMLKARATFSKSKNDIYFAQGRAGRELGRYTVTTGTFSGLEPGTYRVQIHRTGRLDRQCTRTGGSFGTSPGYKLNIRDDGKGELFARDGTISLTGLQSVLGRSLVLTNEKGVIMDCAMIVHY